MIRTAVEHLSMAVLCPKTINSKRYEKNILGLVDNIADIR
jgi:hypothetical protein